LPRHPLPGIARDSVDRVLAAYAERGMFRSYSRTPDQGDVLRYCFTWIVPEPFHVLFCPATGELTFENLLPGIPRGSDLELQLKAFIRGFADPERPEHRRVDPTRLGVRWLRRRGKVSLTFRITGGDYDYGVRKAVNVVNEIFLGFLTVYHPDYMVRNFQASQE